MTKKEKLRVYNDCVHEIGTLQNGDGVDFHHYRVSWDDDYIIIEKEHNYYVVDGYIMRNFLEVVALAYRYCLNRIK